MTSQEKTKQMIEVMLAFADGKAIQYSPRSEEERWRDIKEPIWAWDTSDYRIKPETKPSHNFTEWDVVIAKKLCDGRPLAAGDIKIIRSIDIDELCFENSIKGDAKDYISAYDVLWYWEYQHKNGLWCITSCRFTKEGIIKHLSEYKTFNLAPFYALGAHLPESEEKDD